MITLFLISILLISPIILINGLDTSVEKIVEETSKLEKAKEIFNNIKESNFVKTAQSVSKWGLPLLQSVGFFSKVIMAQFSGESKELTFMKAKFKEINDKMDNVDQEFIEVKKAIDWNVVKVQYSSHEMAIEVLQDIINNIAMSPVNIRHVVVAQFIATYNQIYSDACNKLYESFINQNRVFSSNLIEAVRHFTENHHKKIENFFMGNINLIMKGLQVETFYLNAKNLSGVNESWTTQWDIKLKNLMKIMETASEHVKESYRSQLELDMEKFNVQNYQLGNEAYCAKFYEFLIDKYPWRRWYLVVYNPISSSENHHVSVFGGSIKFRLRGHNIVVGSKDKYDVRMDTNTVMSILNSLNLYYLSNNKGFAEGLLKDQLIPKLKLKNQKYGLAAAIQWGAGVWFMSSDLEQTYKKYNGYNTFNLIVMG